MHQDIGTSLSKKQLDLGQIIIGQG